MALGLDENIKDLRELKKILFDMRLTYDDVVDEGLKSDLKKIIQTGDKVYAELVRNNSKTSSAYRFIHFYLPTINKIVSRYDNLVKNDIKSKDSLEVQDKIVEFMPKVSEALINYYESMFTAEILDVDVELQVLLQRLN